MMLASLGLGRGYTTEVAVVTFLTPTGLIPGKMSWRCCEKQGTKTLPLTTFVWVESHYCNWDLMKRESDMCKICGSKSTIPYYYLSIKNKVQMYCSDAEFCVKVTAHWEERDHWLNCTGGWMPRKKIWDGSRYTAAAYLTQGVSLN